MYILIIMTNIMKAKYLHHEIKCVELLHVISVSFILKKKLF